MRLNKQRTLCIIPELTILTTPLYFLPHNSTQWCSAKLHGRRGMVYPMFTPGQFTMAPLRRLVSNGQTFPPMKGQNRERGQEERYGDSIQDAVLQCLIDSFYVMMHVTCTRKSAAWTASEKCQRILSKKWSDKTHPDSHEVGSRRFSAEYHATY